jgi:hypothetical protein
MGNSPSETFEPLYLGYGQKFFKCNWGGICKTPMLERNWGGGGGERMREKERETQK